MDTRVKAVINMLHQSVEKQLSVCILSKSVNLSPTRLRQLFKQETGRSPLQYLRDVRMHRAEHLLRTTFLTIKEIASLIGVGDVSHFARDFQQQFGFTPREYRTQHSIAHPNLISADE